MNLIKTLLVNLGHWFYVYNSSGPGTGNVLHVLFTLSYPFFALELFLCEWQASFGWSCGRNMASNTFLYLYIFRIKNIEILKKMSRLEVI